MRYLAGLIILIILFGVCHGQEKDLTQGFNKVELASVYDGDTFPVHLAIYFNKLIG